MNLVTHGYSMKYQPTPIPLSHLGDGYVLVLIDQGGKQRAIARQLAALCPKSCAARGLRIIAVSPFRVRGYEGSDEGGWRPFDIFVDAASLISAFGNDDGGFRALMLVDGARIRLARPEPIDPRRLFASVDRLNATRFGFPKLAAVSGDPATAFPVA